MKKNVHTTEVRVRYAETDQMGVVYYSNYLVWFEIARTEFFRARGVVYRKIEEEDKIYLPVVESYCRYRAPVKYDDVVTINTELTEMGSTRIAFSYEVKVGDKVTTIGETKHAFVNASGSPIPVPEKIRSLLSNS
ncbi:MAG: thioesterase family protein [Candidatus Omnitrophica bacterium]|nr:thioesterase family protein [Candidatus Omnitrophota bacterium]